MKVPFVKLFCGIEKKYCYDIPRGRMLELSSDEEYDYLKKWVSGEKGEDIPETIKEKIEDGFLSCETPIKTLKHKYTGQLEDIYLRQLSAITLQVTQDCNFRCKYCVYSEDKNKIQRSHSNKHMTWETAKAALDFLKRHSVDSNYIHVGFYGGEPLIEYPLIHRAMEYAKEIFAGKKLSFGMTTNASLLSEEMIHYFASNKVALLISLDGPEQIHNANRVLRNGGGSYEVVIRSIKRIIELEPEWLSSIKFNMVVDPGRGLEEVNGLFSEIWTKRIPKESWHISMLSKEFDEEDSEVSEKYRIEYGKQEMLSILEELGVIETGEVNIIGRELWGMKKMLLNRLLDFENLYEQDSPGGACIPGNNRLLCTVTGDFYPCEHVSENAREMKIGNLEEGIDPQKGDTFINLGGLCTDECKTCWCFRLCQLCPTVFVDKNNLLSEDKKKQICEQSRMSYESQMRSALLYQELIQRYDCKKDVEE